jgi:hypothetical protein
MKIRLLASVALGLMVTLLLSCAASDSHRATEGWTALWSEGTETRRIWLLRVRLDSGEANLVCAPDVFAWCGWASILEATEASVLSEFAHAVAFDLTVTEASRARALLEDLEPIHSTNGDGTDTADSLESWPGAILWDSHTDGERRSGEIRFESGLLSEEREGSSDRQSEIVESLVSGLLRARGLLDLTLVPESRVAKPVIDQVEESVLVLRERCGLTEGRAMALRLLAVFDRWRGDGLDDCSLEVRTAALMALASNGGEDALLKLGRRLGDEECAEVRRICAQQLSLLVQEDDSRVLDLMERALDKHGDASVVDAAYSVARAGRRSGLGWFRGFFSKSADSIPEHASVMASYVVEFRGTAHWEDDVSRLAVIERWRSTLRNCDGLAWKDGVWR